jgi:predicted nucleotidyltransferase
MSTAIQGVSSPQDRPLPPRAEEIIRTLRAHLPELRQRYSISYLGVFGSYIRGEQKKKSDLDVLVEFSYPPTLFEFMAIEQQLGDLTGVKVDLVMKKTLKPNIGRYILAEVVPV